MTKKEKRSRNGRNVARIWPMTHVAPLYASAMMGKVQPHQDARSTKATDINKTNGAPMGLLEGLPVHAHTQSLETGPPARTSVSVHSCYVCGRFQDTHICKECWKFSMRHKSKSKGMAPGPLTFSKRRPSLPLFKHCKGTCCWESPCFVSC